MKKNIYKWLLIGSVLTNVFTTSAQESSTLYFLDKNPTLHQLNPAYRPEGRFYIGMPGLSSMYFNVGNNCLTFEDVFQGKTIDGKKQTVSFLSRYADNGIDNFLDAMNNNLRVYTDYNMTLLSFGLRFKEKHYVTFGLSNRAEVQLSIPKAIPQVLLKGNSDVDAKQSFDIEDFTAIASLYSEIALGYSQQYNEKLSLGAKYKLLLGHANVHTDFKDMSLTIDKDEWKLTGDGSVDMAVPCLSLKRTADGTLDDAEFDEDASASDFVSPSGIGAAFDLGATYKLLPELTLSASVLDLGFIRWNKNLHSLQKKRDFVFNGVVYEISDRDTVDYGKEYEEIIDHMYTVDDKTSAYNSWLTAKVLLGAEYGVWNNKMTFGLLSKTAILQRKMYEELMLSANFKPWRIFSAALSYSLLDGEWHNLGLATNFNFGPVNYYLAMDQIPLTYAKGDGLMIPTKTRGVNFSMGMNYVFGYKPKKEKAPKEDKCKKQQVEIQDNKPVEKEEDKRVLEKDTVQVVPSVPKETVEEKTVDVQTDTVKQVKDVQLEKIETKEPEKKATDDKKIQKVDEDVTPQGELIQEALYGIRYSVDGHLMMLDERSYPLLNKIVQRMNSDKTLRLSIRGHFHLDERGPEFSRFMSKERARLIRNYMVEQGISANRIDIEGVGADESIATNYTKVGQEKNRRMELRYVK